jgi:predicted regulator of Ras-like GTPase activity (Roadblock/LC7/MglB family)
MTGFVDPRAVFVPVLAPGEAALLVDDAGLVVAGAWRDAADHDTAADMGAALSGISDEANRATRHLGIGDWRTIVFETDRATVTLAPIADASGPALLVVAGDAGSPLGALRRTVARCQAAALAWLGGGVG